MGHITQPLFPGYRIRIEKVSKEKTKYYIQKQVKFLYFFTQWEYIPDHTGGAFCFNKFREALAKVQEMNSDGYIQYPVVEYNYLVGDYVGSLKE